MTEAHTLYRLYDADWHLLYVGITGYPSARFSAHQRDKSWWCEVAAIILEHCESREDLQSREIAAVRDEHPRYNIAMPRHVWPRPRPAARTDGTKPFDLESLKAAGEPRAQAREERAEAFDEARIAAIAAIADGMTEVEAAKLLGVDRLTVCKWLGKTRKRRQRRAD